jgi:S1-C subfamily serine protease
MTSDTVREPRLGLSAAADSNGIFVNGVLPGSAAEEAGVRVGDQLLALGDLPVDSPDFGPAFRARYGKEGATSLPIKVRRSGDTLTLTSKVQLTTRLVRRIEADPGASQKAVRIRTGILRGTGAGQ